MSRDPDEDAAALLRVQRYRKAVNRLRRVALAQPWSGRGVMPSEHRLLVPSREDAALNVSLLLTFDVGYHASGWWRNSEYDRCWHLSMCLLRPWGYEDLPLIDRRVWSRVIFGEHVSKGWWEPPASPLDPYRTAPSSRYVWHLRVFVDRTTGEPIVPAGEVYDLKPWAEGDSPAKVFR